MTEENVPERALLHPRVRRELGADAAVPKVPSRLMASWQRSAEYGVPLESIEPTFTGTFDDGTLFF